MSTPTQALAPRRHPALVIIVLALASLTVAVMQTLMVPLIPELPVILGVHADDASWLITATLLAGAVATPSLSRLADMFGKKRMMLVSLATVVAGSLLAALTSSFVLVVAARTLQGCGMALIPIAISIMRDELPRERLGSAVALVSATLGIGAAIGLPLSGLVFEHLGWHAIFGLSAIIGALMIGAVHLVVPESKVRTGGSFDIVGALLLSGALVGLLLGITKGGSWGWTSTSTLLSLATSLGLFVAWAPWELRVRQPLVDVRTTVRRPVLLTNIASLLTGFAMYFNMLTTTEQLQMPEATGYGFGLPVTAAGLAMLPAGLMMIAMAPVSAAVTRRFGAKVTLATGTGILAVGYLLRLVLTEQVWQVVVGSVVLSTGTAIAYAAMPILIMRAVPVTETAAANGFNTVLRAVGTSTASAVVAASFTSFTIAVAGVDLPSWQAFQRVYVLAAVAAFAAALVALTIPRVRAAAGPAEQDALRPAGDDEERVAAGRVVDAAGRPVAHAMVSVVVTGGEPVDWSRTESDGSFVVAGPESGPFVVVASAPGWTSTSVVVQPGDATPNVLRLEALAPSESR